MPTDAELRREYEKQQFANTFTNLFLRATRPEMPPRSMPMLEHWTRQMVCFWIDTYGFPGGDCNHPEVSR